MKLSIFVGRFFAGVLLLGLIVGVVSHEHVYAQSPAAELESCFVYYDYGRVKVELSSDKSEYIVGENMMLEGQVINNNSFPLINVDIYAQLRRVNKDSFDDNGHYLVDQFYLKRGVNLLPGAASHFKNSYQINSVYPNGEYVLQYFVFSPHGFHYAGRPFLEEDIAGTTMFSINQGVDPQVYFDVDNVLVNGIKTPLRHSQTPEYGTSSITIRIPLIDNRTAKEPVEVMVELYRFENVFDREIVDSRQVTVDNQVLTYSWDLTEKGAFVIQARTESPQKTQVAYRFASTVGVTSPLRLNDVGISDFPAKDTSRAWVCMHSPTFDSTDESRVTISLLDKSKLLVDSLSYTGILSPDVTALSIPLNKITDKTDFWVSVDTVDAKSGRVIDSVSTHYTCDLVADSMSDFTIEYDEKSKHAVLQGLNACGGNVSEITINSLSVTRVETGEKVIEESYVSGSPYVIKLNDLTSGSYSIEARIGDMEKKVSINVETTETGLFNSSLKWWVVGVGLGGLIGVVAAIIINVIRTKQARKHEKA